MLSEKNRRPFERRLEYLEMSLLLSPRLWAFLLKQVLRLRLVMPLGQLPLRAPLQQEQQHP